MISLETKVALEDDQWPGIHPSMLTVNQTKHVKNTSTQKLWQQFTSQPCKTQKYQPNSSMMIPLYPI